MLNATHYELLCLVIKLLATGALAAVVAFLIIRIAEIFSRNKMD